ncbi:uncharacterized protein LOC131848325 [Achroia grisella]|uniref:uncharacterized protein LOC131848325 n=1 Tax=Achroia grisella TaxID=688607 RepID=UPI0027D1FE51|nr:uncharacterized protein LOC131848325 [Achroia grisella]
MSKTVLIFVIIQMSHAINLGLIAGDLKPLGNPLSIKKYSRHSPVIININSKSNPLPSLPLPKLPSKPPFKLPKPKTSSMLSKLRAPLFPPIIMPPAIPKIPLLPLLPILPPVLPSLPLVPPILHPLPLLPPILPLFPLLPPVLPRILPPLKVPILSKSLLQKTLGSEIKPVTVPYNILDRKEEKNSKNIMDKLVELRNKGSLTTAEFIRFKRLLLRK